LSHDAYIHLAPLGAAAHADRERELLPQLAPAEQIRYRGFGADVRRQAWLAGRELLLAALLHVQGAAEPAALLTEAHGGVRYARGGWHLNLSHSGGWLAAAVASVPVGIDIERLRPRAVAAQTARVFCPREAERLALEPDPLPSFWRLWTLKEAACKAAGLTVWDALRRVCFDLETERCEVTPPVPAGPWRFIYGSFASDWRLALALRTGGRPDAACWRREGAGWARMELSDPGVVAAG
jgi:phosphopantetheinyl transferase